MKPYYDDGTCVIYHGEALNILAGLESGSFDVLLTDPPYSSGGMFRSDRVGDPADKYRGWSQATDGTTRKPTAEYGTFGGDCRDQRAWMRWCAAWGMETLRVVRPSGVAFQFTDWRQLPATTDTMQFSGWTWQGVVVWDKGVARPQVGRFRNHVEFVVWATNGQHDGSEEYPSVLIAVPTVGAPEREHVTQKPVELLAHLLRIVPGDSQRIIDPFIGSGSSLVAAKYGGHRAVGIEADERYCEIAARRLSQEVLEFGASSVVDVPVTENLL